MKKKIIAGLALHSLFFALIGISVIFTIENATSELDELIKLHQVEILREHLLVSVKGVQTDLSLRDTPYARTADAIVSHAVRMDKLARGCFACHHSEEVTARLNELRSRLEDYKLALSRVMTYLANTERLNAERDAALRAGEELTHTVKEMVALTDRHLAQHTKTVLARISTTKILLFLLIGAGPLLSAGLAYVYVTSLTKPVSELLAATRRLKGGDLDHRIAGLRDEFGELASSFNEMAGCLKDQMVKMQRTEQMVVVGELAAGLAHEIKNPLAGIKVAMEVLSDDPDMSEENRTVAAKVTDEVRRLEVLMKSFLNFAKPPRPQFDNVDVNRIVEATVGFYLQHHPSPAASGTGIRIVKELDGRVPPIPADLMQIQQTLLNILLNAVDAMPGGGALAIRTFFDPSSDAVEISISDTGKGIEAGMEEKIFQPFFTTKRKGTGLGLSICRQLVEQHGGTISAGGNPGGGTVFRIVLPRRGTERGATA
ncbi:MAG: hypothetical protein A2X88_06115 [Deltaproteobacteria bacterium GWC2_65_14]|nr:MAG: hypothetical protein A2X88_06115 [Deltaproteobacteria bacterium GWC2_65_14]